MPTNGVEPKPKIKFFLKNLRTLIKMKRASRTRIEEFVKANKQLNEPIMPSTENLLQTMYLEQKGRGKIILLKELERWRIK